MRGGDRFADLWQSLADLPQVDLDPDAPVVAVVGPADAVLLEAHRIAVDLAPGHTPRPVVHVPTAPGPERDCALEAAARSAQCVLAVEHEAGDDSTLVADVLTASGASVTIAIVQATSDLDQAHALLDAFGNVDAIALEGVTESQAPMQLLQLGVPITRLDGIPIDRTTWTALLCAQLEAMAPADNV